MRADIGIVQFVILAAGAALLLGVDDVVADFDFHPPSVSLALFCKKSFCYTAGMEEIAWSDFEQVELRVGTIITAEDFPEARKPAYKLTVDFGAEIGVKKSSAQITARYSTADLVGKRVIAVVNFPNKQIGPFVSECLVTGFHDAAGEVVLAVPDGDVPNGAKLS